MFAELLRITFNLLSDFLLRILEHVSNRLGNSLDVLVAAVSRLQLRGERVYVSSHGYELI